uniref:Uncharacterized protein n=1 Tax=Ciona savignyi TaxID=51511 RepID=H2Z8L6_CIOSA
MSFKIYRRVFLRLVGISATYVGVAQMYTYWHIKKGHQNVYKSRWFDELSPEEREKVTDSRANILETLQKLYEMKDLPEKRDIFVQDAILEDPRMTMVGRQEILKCFSLLPVVFTAITTQKFEVQHLPQEIRIFQERMLSFKSPKLTVDRSGTLVVKLIQTSEGEKIVSISDEWDNRPIIGPKNAMFFGYGSYFLRRVSTIYMLTICPYTKTGDILLDSIVSTKNLFFNDNTSNTEDQQLLETPKPKRV